MDVATLTAFLAPFLPILLKFGSKAAGSSATKAGEITGTQLTEVALSKAKAIWEKLYPQVAAKASAQEAAEDVAKAPDDADSQAALRVQLKKILEADPDLAMAIAHLLESDAPDGIPSTQIIQHVTGNRNQAIGQVTGGQVFGNVTGGISIGAAPTATPPKTILILAANPHGTSPLQLSQEVRDIQAGLERARDRDRFVLSQRWAVSDREVRRALLDCAPQIVHFSGHGVGTGELAGEQPSRKLTVEDAEPDGLMFEDATGQPQIVSGVALAQLFQLFADSIECVVLNACYSLTQAKAIAQHIPYVVGMKQAIGDKAAIQFAIGFYDAILAGKSIEFAYHLGCNAVQTAGIPEHLTPQLLRSTDSA
jgi:CHAT domain